MSEGQAQGVGPAQRSVEVAVTIATALFGLIIIWGSMDVGIGWGAEGPKSGFFPFYLGVIIVAGSVINLLEAARKSNDKTFADWSQLRQGVAITIPAAVYLTRLSPIGHFLSPVFPLPPVMGWPPSYHACGAG